MISIPLEVQFFIDVLQKNGYKAYLVGGYVRDALMGKIPKDIDLTTDALPEDVIRVFGSERVIETGIEHGTVTVLSDEAKAEITTFRIDGKYIDNRRPEKVEFTSSIDGDLSRRDFTVNAMAYSLEEGLIDPFGGSADLDAGIIRTVGNPDDRFKEDALRIMRALRMYSELGFLIESETSKSMFRFEDNLLSISPERISYELVRILCGKNVKSVLKDYKDIFATIIPELRSTFGFEHSNKHHIYDVFSHTLEVIDNTPAEPVLRIAALLHDIGKPQTFSVDKDGVGHFYGHPKVSSEMALSILKRLKLDSTTCEQVTNLVLNHNIFGDLNEKSMKRLMNKYSPEFMIQLFDLIRADILGQNPVYSYRLDTLEELWSIYKGILDDKDCFRISDLAINGNDLVELGFAEGPEIGKILNECLENVISDKTTNTRENLLNYAIMKKLNS